MKIFLRFVPILAGLVTCGIVGGIGVMFSMNDTSGNAVKIVAFVAVVVSVGVVLLVEYWLGKKKPQNPK